MSRRRPDPGPARLLCVDKQAGPTSHDVVRELRRITRRRKVGHSGTLDPFATGLLVCGLDAATRLLGLLSDSDKEYLADVRFGIATDSLDSTGAVIEDRPLEVRREELEAVIPRFLGEQEQMPPRLSAIRVEGRRSYDRVRAGEDDFELAPRRVRIDSIDLLDCSQSEARLRVRCGGGTYVRSLARDLGEALGGPAHLRALRRTRVGPFGLDDAASVEAIAESWPDTPALHRPTRLLPDRALHRLDEEQVRRVRQGVQPEALGLELSAVEESPARLGLVDEAGELVAVVEPIEDRLRLRLVLPEAS